MWSRFLNSLVRLGKHDTATPQPLLNPQEITYLHEAAISRHAHSLEATHEVLHPLLGERSSIYAGSGFEFADNRLYSAGDDMRFINWRLLARSGQMYRKLFIEERRPEVWLVVDRRQSMRFGTRIRLKVTQAARVAIYYLHKALHQQLACGAILLQEQAHWLEPVRSIQSAHTLQQHLIEPAPPDNDMQTGVKLASVLQQLLTQLTAGSIVVLVSDFHDLSDDMSSTLYALNQKHTLLACHIVDPVELNTVTTQFFIQNSEQDRLQLMRGDESHWRDAWRQQLAQHHHAIQKILQGCGSNYQSLLTNAELIRHGPYTV